MGEGWEEKDKRGEISQLLERREVEGHSRRVLSLVRL